MHMSGTLWKRTRKLRLAIEKEAKLASLEMGPALGAEPLARIGRIADAAAAEVASQSRVKFRHALGAGTV